MKKKNINKIINEEIQKVLNEQEDPLSYDGLQYEMIIKRIIGELLRLSNIYGVEMFNEAIKDYLKLRNTK